MSNPMFYVDPVPLNSQEDKDLKLGDFVDYAFAAESNSIQLVGVEFYEAAKEYPIVFAKLGNGAFVPFTLNGLKDKENLYLDKDNKWDARYIPSYVRRYPFVLSEPIGDEGKQVVFIDKGCKRVQKKSGQALFNKDGSEGEVMASVKSFLLQHYAHARLTADFCQWLADEDLLTEMAAKFEVAGSGESFLFNSLYIVDEAKFQKLGKDKVFDLFTKGFLGWVYAHLMSLSNMSQLLDRYAKKIA